MNKLTLLFLIFGAGLTAQTPFYTNVINGKLPDSVAYQASFSNPWFGSSFAYALDGDDDLRNNFLIGSRLLYQLSPIGKMNMPIIGNINLSLVNIASGINNSNFNVGLYPYYVSKTSNNRSIIWHGAAKYTLSPAKDLASSRNEYKLLGGIEYITYSPSGKPSSFSITPGWLHNGLGMPFVEGTFVLPIANNMGFLADAIIPLKAGNTVYKNPSFSLGVIIMRQL